MQNSAEVLLNSVVQLLTNLIILNLNFNVTVYFELSNLICYCKYRKGIQHTIDTYYEHPK